MGTKTIKVEEVRSIFTNDSGTESSLRTVNSSDIESITYKGNETYDVLYVKGHIERFHGVKCAIIKLVDQEVNTEFTKI